MVTCACNPFSRSRSVGIALVGINHAVLKCLYRGLHPLRSVVHSMKAFVLAGGAGTRLSPLTSYVPKGMIPIGGRPFIDYVLDYLSTQGIRQIVMLLSEEESEVFRNHLEDGSKYGVNLGYSISPRAGTAVALREAANLVDGTFVVYYGDVLTSLDLAGMIKYHREKGSVCTIALSTGVKIDYGVGRVDADGRILYFAEKPVLAEYPVSIGVYVCEPRFLTYLSRGTDLARDILPSLIASGEKFYGFVTREPHHDIGSFKQLDEAKQILKSHRTGTK